MVNNSINMMVNNSINIIKTKESLNSDGQQFLKYQTSNHFSLNTIYKCKIGFLRVLRFLHWSWNIVEGGIKRHNPDLKYKIMTYDVRNLGSVLWPSQKCGRVKLANWIASPVLITFLDTPNPPLCR